MTEQNKNEVTEELKKWEADFRKALHVPLKHFPKEIKDHPHDHIRWCWYYEGRKDERKAARVEHEKESKRWEDIIFIMDDQDLTPELLKIKIDSLEYGNEHLRTRLKSLEQENERLKAEIEKLERLSERDFQVYLRNREAFHLSPANEIGVEGNLLGKNILSDEEWFNNWAIEHFNISPDLIDEFLHTFPHKLRHTKVGVLKLASVKNEIIKSLEQENKALIELGVDSGKEIERLTNRNNQLEDFCQEFVYGEENPDYYKTMAEKLKECEQENERLKKQTAVKRCVACGNIAMTNHGCEIMDQLKEREEMIKTGINYMKEAHNKFTPHVTNSLALDWIEKARKMVGEK